MFITVGQALGSRTVKPRAVLLVLALIAHAPGVAGAADADRALLVFAAASLTDALGEVAAAYTATYGQRVKVSYASSGILARQLDAGADADVFFSADVEWMDYVDARALVDRDTRIDLLTNRLVLIAPAGEHVPRLDVRAGFDLLGALAGGRLAVGDPESVPAGRYARTALMSLGVWPQVIDRLVRADNVRAALAFVARGEAPLGIVYETDARAEGGVAIVATLPADSHLPIVYPVAATARAHDGAARFVEYLRGAQARAAFERWGFGVVVPPTGAR
jgi:molybdate transport system substrate-binding protein